MTFWFWIKLSLAVFALCLIGWWAWQCAQMADAQRKQEDDYDL